MPYHVPPFTESIDTPPAPEPPKLYNTPLVLREIDPAETRMPTDIAGARAFLANLRAKMASLAEDFALGKINKFHSFLKREYNAESSQRE